MATQWTALCIQTLQSALAKKHIEDIICDADDEEVASDRLQEHFKFAVCTLQRFTEFQLIYLSFPWRFFLLLDPAWRERVLKEMKAEWSFVLEMESLHSGDLKKYPWSQLPHTRWYVYREVMTYAAERSFQWHEDIAALVAAWYPDPVSTLGADEVFRQMRSSERVVGKTGQASPIQLQSVAIKALEGKYQCFDTPQLSQRDYAGIEPGAFVKRGIFDSSRATASETGVAHFNSMCRADTMSPHMISRKALNLLHSLMKTGGISAFLFLCVSSLPSIIY